MQDKFLYLEIMLACFLCFYQGTEKKDFPHSDSNEKRKASRDVSTVDVSDDERTSITNPQFLPNSRGCEGSEPLLLATFSSKQPVIR